MDVKVCSPPPHSIVSVPLTFTQPVRPTRSTRARQDENHPALQQKTKNAAAVKADKPVGGLKAAARRQAFTDVSNKVSLSKAAVGKENAKGLALQTKDSLRPAKTSAISKPAQRSAGLKNTAASATIAQQAMPPQQAGPRRVARKTAVYEDKKPSPKRRSPKKPSPKVSRDAVTKRGDSSLPTTRTAGVRAQAPLRSLGRIKHESKEDEPVYSDQQTHFFDDDFVDYEDEAALEEEEDEDATDAEEDVVDNKSRFNADVETVSEYDVDLSEDDDDFTTAHSRAGDNTTSVTTQILIPKWTAKARQEITKLNAEFADLHDEDEEADISMVAEYGDEIFEYMRELEVNNYRCCVSVQR